MTRSQAYSVSAAALLTVGALGMISARTSEEGFGTNLEGSEGLGSSELRIESLSTRSYLVTGGDVLLRIAAGRELDLSRVEVSANGADVTGQFRPTANGGSLIGLVQGLRTGDNEIEARIAESEVAAIFEQRT